MGKEFSLDDEIDSVKISYIKQFLQVYVNMGSLNLYQYNLQYNITEMLSSLHVFNLSIYDAEPYNYCITMRLETMQSSNRVLEFVLQVSVSRLGL